jgi:lysine 2,3-aminomutase
MDDAEGLEHLRTPLAKGVEIIAALRGFTSGLAVPHLAVDLPGGGGKVTLQPDYVLERRAGETILRNYRGDLYSYPEPAETDCSVPYDEIFYPPALSNSFGDGTLALAREPARPAQLRIVKDGR